MAGKKILYVGPSWAKRNYEPNDPPNLRLEKYPEYTNIKKECNLDVIDLAQYGASNFDMLKNVREFTKYDGIIWIYCEPIIDIEKLGITTKTKFLTSENFWALRNSTNNILLDEINNLKKPVALIGSHSDIYKKQISEFTNLTVIYESWQKFLVNHIEYDYLDRWKDKEGWGAEVAHLWLHETKARPSKQLVYKIDDTFFIWSLLEKHNLFYQTHPTKQGIVLFSKVIKPILDNWLKKL